MVQARIFNNYTDYENYQNGATVEILYTTITAYTYNNMDKVFIYNNGLMAENLIIKCYTAIIHPTEIVIIKA